MAIGWWRPLLVGWRVEAIGDRLTVGVERFVDLIIHSLATWIGLLGVEWLFLKGKMGAIVIPALP